MEDYSDDEYPDVVDDWIDQSVEKFVQRQEYCRKLVERISEKK